MVICDVCGKEAKDFDSSKCYSLRTKNVDEICYECVRKLHDIKGKGDFIHSKKLNQIDDERYEYYAEEVEKLRTMNKN